jgi:hypothetical protein
MSNATPGPIRLLSFGDAAGEIWGAVVQAGATATLIMTPRAAAAATGAGQVELAADGDAWRLSAAGVVSLRFTPSGTQSGAGDELCHVQGTVTVGGAERELSCPGTISTDTEAEPRKLDSIRALSGWFAEDRGLALRALRADAKKGHERDVVAATLFDPEQWVTVADPRLSTTFRPGEQPARASLELWVGQEEDMYPRRVAAEAIGLPAEASGDELRLSLTPMLCHAGGLDGTGVYLIAHL